MNGPTSDLSTAGRAEDWRDAAACRSEDPSLFSPDGSTGPWLLIIEQAKAVCRRCPSRDLCLQWALDERIAHGVWGGLSEQERQGLRRTTQRRGLSPEEAAAKAEQPRQSPKQETLQEIFAASTRRLTGGHLAWIGKPQTRFDGQVLTPKQVCFIVGRGHAPNGRVLADCGISECVLPAHLSDAAERTRCGTRGGYQKHLAERTEICRHCRRANADADARLRRTGTSKALV